MTSPRVVLPAVVVVVAGAWAGLGGPGLPNWLGVLLIVVAMIGATLYYASDRRRIDN